MKLMQDDNAQKTAVQQQPSPCLTVRRFRARPRSPLSQVGYWNCSTGIAAFGLNTNKADLAFRPFAAPPVFHIIVRKCKERERKSY